jgi:GTPase SAR1 family protein
MVMADITWILPAAYNLYEHGYVAAGVWRQIRTRLLTRKSRIAVTGLPGVGKTVLVDYLTGRAESRDYTPPGRSTITERSNIDSAKRRIGIAVAPAQKTMGAAPIERLLSAKRSIDGIVHVVSDGFVHHRESFAPGVMGEYGLSDLKTFREYHRKREIEHLNELCSYLEASFRIIVAVTKLDLLADEIESVRIRYSPAGSGEFVDSLNRLQATIGALHFRWEAAPVCAWLEDFEWNGTTVSSSLRPHHRNHYLRNFLGLLDEFSDATVAA